MWSAKTNKILLAILVAAAFAAALLVLRFSSNDHDSGRAQLLRFVPAAATSVVFADLDQLRNSPFLSTLYAWTPHPAEDSEYTQFVLDTGFHYERDLGKVLIAISNHSTNSGTLVLAEGKFDRKKIEAYLAHSSAPVQQGHLKVFRIPAKAGDRPISFSFLSDRRIAITDSENLDAVLSTANLPAGHAEWQTHFDRLAGSPLFAVIRQDPTVETALAIQSPQLATFIAQLPWITLAGKPNANLLHVVVEGESPSDAIASQLSEFLQGIQVLAQNGLNDPELRQRMDPEERDAYFELLKGTQIDKIGRGESKSVRVVLPITPRILQLAQSASLAPRLPPDVSPTGGTPAPHSKNSQRRKN
jgi:hypothetical protein